jgi:serine/threonine protein kinase
VRLAESWTARSGERIGAYRLDEKLGEGGMGVVYAASRDDAQYRQSVAIKILRHGLGSPSAIARFRDERQILASLEHPNIVRLLDGGSTDDASPYIVMEHVRGVSITEYATSRGLVIRARVQLFADVCAAVHYAHERGVIHRDLKPSNILVDETGTPKLVRAGDLASARAKFEEALLALAVPHNGVEGFSYMTPVAQLALAQLLPEADRARARRLALRARDGFARLGPHRSPDREAAIRWLSEHPDLLGGEKHS